MHTIHTSKTIETKVKKYNCDSFLYKIKLGEYNSVIMEGIKSEVARLLNSDNAQVAAAAKRFFFETETYNNPSPQKKPSSSKTSSLLVGRFGTCIEADVQEAATCTVEKIAPIRNVGSTVEPGPVATKEVHTIKPLLLTSNASLQGSCTPPSKETLVQQSVTERAYTTDERLKRR